MANHKDRFNELSKMKFSDQAVWFLNAWWFDLKNKEAMKIWDYVEKFVELDKLGEKTGNELDVFFSAKFLESFDQTLTATARKEALRQIDQNSNGKMSCIEYLVWKYKKGINQTVDAPQGTSEELVAAQAALKKVEESLEKVRAALEELSKLEKELQKAIDDLNHEEKVYKEKCDGLQSKIDDPNTSGMQRSKASNELAQLKGEDPLPLRRAKITQEAALRKVGKQKLVVEQQENNLLQELTAAQKQVDKAKAAGGANAPGLLWWMQRQMFEADARLPSAKQKFNHKQPFSYEPSV